MSGYRHAKAYIGIGSNLGDRVANCEAAIRALDLLPGIRMIARSSFHESAPLGDAAQGPYINAAIAVETALSPRLLLETCLQVERHLGRRREPGERWQARMIDLDLLFYDDLEIEEFGLIVPHPEIHRRSFVLMPLSEIAGTLRHPGKRQSVNELLKNLSEPTACRRYRATAEFDRPYAGESL